MSDESKFDLSSWEASNDVGYDRLVMAYMLNSEEMPSDASRALKDLARESLADMDGEFNSDDLFN